MKVGGEALRLAPNLSVQRVDAAEGLRGGGRLDWTVGLNQLTRQGDVFDNEVPINEDLSGIENRAGGRNAGSERSAGVRTQGLAAAPDPATGPGDKDVVTAD